MTVWRLASVALFAYWLGTMPVLAQSAGTTSDDLFDGATLHDVWVHINARDWSQLKATYQKNTYYPCDLEWRGLRVYNAGCKSRGSASRNGIKPGLRIQFDQYVTGQTFLGLRALVLDNFWQEPTMVRERLSMQVMQRMGVPAPRESFARVFIGSGRDYAGLYALVEDVDQAFLRRNYGDDSGYLYDYNAIDAYHFEDLGLDLEPCAARFEPKTHESDSAVALYAPLRDLVRAITDATPDDLELTVGPHLDVRAFLTEVAVENYLSEWDGVLGDLGMSNVYFYRIPGRLPFQVIPWDKDNTFTRPGMPPWQNVEANVLMRNAWAVPALRAFYLSRLLEAATLGPWLQEEAEREYALIHAAALTDPVKQYSNDAFEQAFDELRRFTRERSANVRAFVDRLTSGASGAP